MEPSFTLTITSEDVAREDVIPMRPGSFAQRRFVYLLIFGALLVTFINASAHGSTIAHAAIPNNCVSSVADRWSRYENVEFQTEASGSCYASFPTSTGYVTPCAGHNVTVEADVWLSQSTVPGGKRLAESGRTGYLTWASDCNSYQIISITGWGQYYTVPLWGCGWYWDVDTGETWDYVCGRAY